MVWRFQAKTLEEQRSQTSKSTQSKDTSIGFRKVKAYRYFIEKNHYTVIFLVHTIQYKCICPQAYVGKFFGLYDPVLDDTEYIYVPIEPEINSEGCELTQGTNAVTETHTGNNGTIKEPLNVPEFNEKNKSKSNFDEALPKISAGDLPESARFKLPISDEYDPEGQKVTKLQKLYAKNITAIDLKMIIEKIKQNENNKVTKNLKTTFAHTLPSKLHLQSEEEMTKNESQYSKLKNDINLETLKKTASRIVGESLDRALSLATEIKQEIDVELEKTQNFKNKSSSIIRESLYSDSKSLDKSTIEKDVDTNKEYSMDASKTETYTHNEEITLHEEKEKLIVADEIQKFESLNAPMDSKVKLEERKLLTQHDVKETIEEGTVRRRSEIFTKEMNMSNNIVKKVDTSSKLLSKSFNEHKTTPTLNLIKPQIHENIKSDTKEIEKRAFTLGLQTVPHVHRALLSLHNSNLLLKTFFLQLTKVMVALSKILTVEQNTLPHGEKSLEIKKNIENINHINESKTTQKDKEDIEIYNSTNVNFEEQIIKKEKLSGAKIAQIEGNKPAELTDKMDIVISELLEKTTLEDYSHNEIFFRKDNQSDSYNNKDSQHGNFFDQQGKYFDRRKLFEILKEKTNITEIKEMISKKYTTEYKSMKTNKQNGNIIYYIALVEAKHFPNFEEIRRTKNLYEHEIKTEMKNDENLVYVAIVEAHAKINEEAILKEQMRRQFENKMSISKQSVELKDSKVVEAIEIGTQKLYLANTAVIEPVEVSVTALPLEHKPVKFARSATDMEQISKKIAVQNIVHAIEPLLRHESQKMYNKQARSIIEKPTKATAESMDVKVEESQTFFKAEVSVKQRSFISIEKPKLVVDVTEIIIEEDENIPVEISKPIVLEPHPAIEIAGKSVAEVSEIIATEGPKENVFKLPEPEKQLLNIDIKQLKSRISNIVLVQESHKNIEIFEKSAKLAQILMEKCSLVVASTLAILLGGPMEGKFKIPSVVANRVKILIEMPKLTVAEIITNFLEEPIVKHLKIPAITLEKSRIIIKEFMSLIKTLAIPIEQCIDLDLQKVEYEMAQVSLETKFLSVGVTLAVLLAGPKDDIIHIKPFITDQVNVLMEMPHYTLAKILINSFLSLKERTFETPETEQEQCNITIEKCLPLTVSLRIPLDSYTDLKISNSRFLVPETNIESIFLTVASYLTILLAGPKEENYQTVIVNTCQAKTVMEMLNLIAPEVVATFVNGPQENNFEIPKILIENCDATVNEYVSLVGSIMIPVDHYNEIELPKIIKVTPFVTLENTFMPVAMVLTMLMYGPSCESFEVLKTITYHAKIVYTQLEAILTSYTYAQEPREQDIEQTKTKIQKHEARVKIEELKAAEVKFTPIEEPAPEELIISDFKKKQIQTSLQSSSLTVPEILAILSIDSVDYGVSILKTSKQKASINVETLKSAEAIITTPEEPKEEIVLKTHRDKKNILCSVADTNLLAAETSIVQIEERENIGLDIKTDKNLKAHVKIEEQKAFETRSINIIEPKSEVFGVPLSENNHIKTVIEKPLKTVAQVTTINTNEIETQELSSSKNMNLRARVSVEELKALEAMVTNIEEPKSEVFQSSLMSDNRHIRALIEKPIKTTAQVMVINTGEFENQINTIQPAHACKHAKMEVESAASVALHNIITAIEETHDLNHGHSSIRTSAKSSIVESSMKAIAEINEKDTEVNMLIEKPKSRPMKTEDIEIEANFKIPTPLNDSVNEVSAEYNIKIPQEENVYAEYGFGERKIDVDSVSEIYESIRLMKKHAFQKQSMEASLSLARELQTKIEMAEIDTLQEEFIQSGSISTSSSMASSPLTPLLEEYFFNVRGPSLKSRYRYFQDVIEEASLKLKSKIQTSTIQNLDASLTLILQDIAMAHLESETNDVEVIEIDDYEDIRNLHFSTALMARSREESLASFLSSEVQSLKAMHASSVSRNLYGYTMSVEDSDLKKEFIEASLSNGGLVSQESSATQHLDKKNMERKASKSVKFADTAEYAEFQYSSAKLRTSDSGYEMEGNMHINCEFDIPTSGEFKVQPAKYKKKCKDINSLNVNSLSFDSKALESSRVKSQNMESSLLETTSIEGGSIKMSSAKNCGEMAHTGASLEIQLHQGFDSSSARSTESHNKLFLKTDIKGKEGIDLKSPSPPTLPPTPLTDEYMFRVLTKMPEPSEFVPRDCSFSPENVGEDIILKGGLIPHIRTRIERILYSPPYITPPTSPDKTVPVYSKGGGKSGIFKFLS